MSDQPMFIQKGSTHYNVKNIIKMVTGPGCKTLKLHFIDGSVETLRFEDEHDYGEFMVYIRSLNCE